jgi:hypothetical protein
VVPSKFQLRNLLWWRKTWNEVKFGIVKTIIFLLTGYSLSYVDENKTINQNKYNRIILYIPVASVVLSKCRDNFKSHISICAQQQLIGQYSSNHRPVHNVWNRMNQSDSSIFCKKPQKTYFPHLNPHSWRLRQNFNVPRFRTNNSTYIRCHYLGETRRTKVRPSQTVSELVGLYRENVPRHQ